MNFTDQLNRRRLRSHVRETEDGQILPDYLAAHFPRFDRAGWLREIAADRVAVNGGAASSETVLAQHDCVAYFPPETPEPDAELHYRVVYADSDLLVIDKPGNLCVHPTGPFFRHTLWYLAGRDWGELRFINRLDRETSGLLIAARNVETAARMDNRRCPLYKEYLALVFGRFRGTVRARGVLEPDGASAVFKKKRFRFADGVFPDSPEFADT